MMSPTIIAVDPGERWVGAIVRRGPELVDHDVVHRDGPDGDDPDALDRWLDDVTGMLERLLETLGDPIDAWRTVDLVAIEYTGPPRGHARGRDGHLIALGPLMVTAQVGGAASGWGRGHGIPTAFVRPQRHGALDLPDGTPPRVARAALLQSYPAALVGPRETTGTGKSPRQHARAAWDIAAAGALHLRVRRAA